LEWLILGVESTKQIIYSVDKKIMRTAIEIAEKIADGYIVPPEDKTKYIADLYDELFDKKLRIQRNS